MNDLLRHHWQALLARLTAALDAAAGKTSHTSDPAAPAALGLTIIGAGLGIFLIWALFAPLGEGVVAPGVVNVDVHRKTVQHLKGGIVKAIRVKDGDRVLQDAPLIELDDTQWRAQRDLALGQYLAARAIEARLIAERDGKDSIEYPGDLSAEAATAGLADVLRVQRELFESRRRSLEGEIAIYTENIAGQEEHIAGLQVLERNKARQAALFEQELAALRKLLEKGHVARVQVFEVERSLADLTGTRGEILGNIATTRKNIAELKLKILQSKQDFLKEVEGTLEKTGQEMVAAHERLKAAQDDLARSIVTAPESGLVMGLAIHTQGGVIRGGDDIMYIVPESTQLTLDARVRPQDIDKVSMELPADVRFTAFNQRTTPVVAGKVTVVGADRTEDKRSGEPYYAARIAITEQGMAQLGNLRIQPGMPADVIIKTGERTFMAYLLKPLIDRLAKSFKED